MYHDPIIIKKILVALNQIFDGAQVFVHQTSGLYYLEVNVQKDVQK